MNNIPYSERDLIPFFSPLPRHVYTLRQNGILKTRDVEVLGLLLDYKGKHSTVVCPSQDTLCQRLGCKHDTIARSIARLRDAGLIAVNRLRDLRGRLGKWQYDLAAVFNFMPAKDAAATGTQKRTGKNDGGGVNEKQASTHGRGVTKGEVCSVKADKQETQEPLTPEAEAVVSEMVSLGADKKLARDLAQKHGPARCKEVVTAAKRKPGKIGNVVGWVRDALTKGWTVGAAKSAPARQKSFKPAAYVPAWEDAPAKPQEPIVAPPVAVVEVEQPAAPGWGSLTPEQQRPYREQAKHELLPYALEAGAKAWARMGPRQEMVRARNLYEAEAGEKGRAI